MPESCGVALSVGAAELTSGDALPPLLAHGCALRFGEGKELILRRRADNVHLAPWDSVVTQLSPLVALSHG